jgi:acyl carrier protein
VVDALLQAIHARPGGPDDPLGLSSLQVVHLVDAIEAVAGVRLAAADVRAEHFATRRALTGLLSAKGVACG